MWIFPFLSKFRFSQYSFPIIYGIKLLCYIISHILPLKTYLTPPHTAPHTQTRMPHLTLALTPTLTHPLTPPLTTYCTLPLMTTLTKPYNFPLLNFFMTDLLNYPCDL